MVCALHFCYLLRLFSTNNQFALWFTWAALSGFVEIFLNKNKKCIWHGISMDSGSGKVHFGYLFRLEIGSMHLNKCAFCTLVGSRSQQNLNNKCAFCTLVIGEMHFGYLLRFSQQNKLAKRRLVRKIQKITNVHFAHWFTFGGAFRFLLRFWNRFSFC